MTLDITIIGIYLAAIIAIGLRFSAKSTLSDYFLGGRSIPWLIASFSIVATETSTLTFISIPGLAYLSGLGFLQVAAGYLVGRILVALLLIPRYYNGRIKTVYGYLQQRFGIRSRKMISIIFHITRLLADSVRLFATAIPLAMLTGWDYRLAVLVIGFATLIYTYYGGLRSVIVVDSIQLVLYIACGIIAIQFILQTLGVSFFEMFGRLEPGSLTIFSFDPRTLFSSYNAVSGIVGGAFLSFATHGTDHLFVQRVLSCSTKRGAQKAMIFSGIFIIIQFALFLLLGLFLKELFNAQTFERGDLVFPTFITDYLPGGLRGLMLAGIFAAAMSTLSSSINALSSSTVIDILNIGKSERDPGKQVRISRLVSILWACLLMGVALLIRNSENPLVEVGLTIASITYGGVLFIFIMGLTGWHVEEIALFAGVVCAILISLCLYLFTPVFWIWYIVTGSITGICICLLFMRLLRKTKIR